MNKKIYAMLMAGLMLAIVFSTFSVNASEHAVEKESIQVIGGVAPCNTTGIWGLVFDSDTGEPIEGAHVTFTISWPIEILLGTTNSDGYYLIDTIPNAGTLFTIKATKIGYFSATKEVVYPRSGQSSIRIDFYLDPNPLFPDPISTPGSIIGQSSQQTTTIVICQSASSAATEQGSVMVR